MMFRRLRLRHLTPALALLMTGISDTAQARICIPPTAPFVFISKPTKPFCAARRTCSDWEVHSYQDDVERYYKKLKNYLETVDQYQAASYDYAKCMADLD